MIAKSFVKWPNVDRDLDSIVNSCTICYNFKSTPQLRKLKPWSDSPNISHKLHIDIDYLSKINNYHFFILIDAKSKWIQCFLVKNITTEITNNNLIEIFTPFCLCVKIVSDNATQFLK